MITVERMELNGLVMTDKVMSVNLQPSTIRKFFPSPSLASDFVDKLSLLPSDIRKTLDPMMRTVPGWTYSLEDLRDSETLTKEELPLPSDVDETLGQFRIPPLLSTRDRRWE